jgi:L-ascorbate metabolism protein UlaG (beta-lactamase superfamily)
MNRIGTISVIVGVAISSGSTAVAAPLRGQVTVTHLGVGGWSVTDNHHTILVDPYFSRPSDLDHPVSDEHAVTQHTPTHADLILVGHAHVDHALDVPAIARRTGAPIVGSAEMAKKARDAGIPDGQILLVKGGEDYQFDGFSVRVIPSLHSATGLAAGGDVQTFAYLVRIDGVEILIFDTANYIERELEGLRPNVAIVATGLREKVRDYSCRLMQILGRPPVVLATHFDEWRKPLGTPLPDKTSNDLRAFTAEIQHCAKATRVIVPQPFVPISVP